MRQLGNGQVEFTCSKCGEKIVAALFSQEAMNGVCDCCLDIINPDWGCDDD